MNAKIKARQTSGMHPSLLDVMCCLVFIFLLTSLLAASSQQEAREKTLPPVDLTEMPDEPGSNENRQEKVAVVTVKQGPVYLIDNDEINAEELGARLGVSHIEEVDIRGDNGVPYGYIMNVMRICRESRIDKVALTYSAKE